MAITLLIFLLILSVLVLIHEFGHFITAKKFGIKVEEFGFGFPPKAFSIKKGETVYSINWLPIGGFVKLFGEDEAGGGKLSLPAKNKEPETRNKDLKRAFFARPVGQRALIVVAGVVMNTLLAIVIFYAFLYLSNFKTQFPLLAEHKFWLVNQTNKNVNSTDKIISVVAPDSPAQKIGIKPPVEIISINNQPVKDRKNIVDIINKNKGKKITISWQELNSDRNYTKEVTPRKNPPDNEGALGIGFFPIAILHYETQTQKILSGVVHPVNIMAYNFNVLSKLVSFSIKEKSAEPLGESVAGPVGIFSLVGTIVQIPDLKEKVLQILNLAGILSISLAFFNILPIPALDGGRLLFIGIEAITGKKVPQRIEGMAHTIGMAILLALIVLITFKDILKIFG